MPGMMIRRDRRSGFFFLGVMMSLTESQPPAAKTDTPMQLAGGQSGGLIAMPIPDPRAHSGVQDCIAWLTPSKEESA